MMQELIYSKRTFFFALAFILSFIGFYQYALHEESNHCEMTFMYQYPQFLPVKLNSNVTKRFPNYNLFIYGEGEYALSLGQNIPRGIPVLFVPGNGGSFKQVRSFGSIALRMAEEKHISHHLNFFTINFNEELSGLFGPMLEDQTEFLYESICAIKNLYLKEQGRNVSLILIGHSIGGLVSRGVYTIDSFDPSFIDLIITLATPHFQPALQFDGFMKRYYDKVNEYWHKNRHTPKLSHLSIISIGGGFRDKLVKSDLALLPVTSENDFSLVTTSISDVWLSIDHLCIVWCRQLIVKLTRLLYELLDFRTRKVMSALDRRNQTITYHLFNRNRGFSINQHVPEYLNIPKKGNWLYFDNRYFKFQRNKIFEPTYLLIPLVPNMVFTILTNNVLRKDWIFGCNASLATSEISQKATCETGINLSLNSQLIYNTFGSERKFYKEDMNNLLKRGFDHIMIYLSPSPTPVSVISERYSLGKRNKIVILPSIVPDLISLFFSPTIIAQIPITEEGIFYNFTLIGFNQIWHNYWIRVEVKQCYDTASEYSLIHFSVPWSKEDSIMQISPIKGKRAHMALSLNVPKKDINDKRNPHLILMLEPNCGYVIKFKLSFIEVLTQLIRHYYNSLLPFISAIVTSSLSMQIFAQRSSSIASLIKKSYGPQELLFFPLPMVLKDNFLAISLYGLLPAFPVIFDKISKLFYKRFGINYLSTSEQLTIFQHLILNMVLYTFAYSLIYIISLFIHFIVYLFNKIILISYQIFIKEIKTTSLFDKENIKILPLVISLVLIAFSLLTCSSYCLISAIFLHLYKLLLCFQKSYRWTQKKGQNKWSTLPNVDLTLLLLMIIAFAPTIPIGLVFFNSNYASSDFHLMPVSCISLSLSILFQSTNRFQDHRYSLYVLSILLKILSLATLGLGLHSYDYITVIISLTLISYSLYRMLCICPNRIKND